MGLDNNENVKKRGQNGMRGKAEGVLPHGGRAVRHLSDVSGDFTR